LLGYLSRKGWLARVRRGLYLTVPLDAARPGQWIEDPWVVAKTVFSPCYVGGWSAAGYWELTEQLFRDLLVVTSRPTRRRHHVIQDMPFEVVKRSDDALTFGVRPVWRGSIRAEVSDPSRTIVDMLADPSIGGGIRHIAAVLDEYLLSEHRDDELLVAHGDRIGNRSIFKRLGWLLEATDGAEQLVEACLRHRSTGIVNLDPTAGASGHIVRRWGLRVNVAIGQREDDP
jgi:predicted transcriptional regulator of viral defense system